MKINKKFDEELRRRFGFGVRDLEFCERCGAKLIECPYCGQVFCPNCGYFDKDVVEDGKRDKD